MVLLKVLMQSGNYENIYDDNRELSVHSYMRRTTRREWLREVFFLKIKSTLSELEEVRSPIYSIILLILLIYLTQIKDL